MSPSPSCGCGYRRATEANGLSAFRASGTAWFRWRRCWSLVPSLRWTCCPSSMDSVPGWMPRWLSGEELLVLLPDADLLSAREHAERIRQAIKSINLTFHGQALDPVTISLGVATFPAHASD